MVQFVTRGAAGRDLSFCCTGTRSQLAARWMHFNNSMFVVYIHFVNSAEKEEKKKNLPPAPLPCRSVFFYAYVMCSLLELCFADARSRGPSRWSAAHWPGSNTVITRLNTCKYL